MTAKKLYEGKNIDYVVLLVITPNSLNIEGKDQIL
jgi:hypothetical protein